MNRNVVRILATASAVAVIMSGAVLERRSVVIDDIQTRTASSSTLSSEITAAQRTELELVSTLADHDARAALSGTLVEARAPFLAAVGAFGTTLESATGKVDASAHRARVETAQDAVLAERDRPDVVAAATETVRSSAGELDAAVKSYDEEQRRIAEAAAAAAAAASAAKSRGGSGGWSGGASIAQSRGGGGGGGGNAVDRARGALAQVGGGHIAVRAYDGNCQGRYADTCSYSSGYIAVAPAIAGYSQSRLLWAMAHEFAHQAQFGVWGSLQRSGTFAALYGGNMEKLANCMAAVRGYGSGCSAEQMHFASGVWNRDIAG